VAFELQFAVTDIEALAERYDFDSDEETFAAGRAARARGHYTKQELVLLCEWKTPRSRSRVARNTEGFVVAMTAASLTTADETERLSALTAMRGVEVPTASVLLHFVFPERYPIIDWRALESLGEQARAAYPVAYWLEYVDVCQRLAQEAGVSMRQLDKALWQHSKELSVAERK
jgi:hypothetical protein